MPLNCYVDAERKINETYIDGLYFYASFVRTNKSIKNAEIKLEVLLSFLTYTRSVNNT